MYARPDVGQAYDNIILLTPSPTVQYVTVNSLHTFVQLSLYQNNQIFHQILHRIFEIRWFLEIVQLYFRSNGSLFI